MKALYKMLAVGAVLCGSTLTASAQYDENKYADRVETRTYPNYFVGVQGGAQGIINGYKFSKVLTPIGAVQGGVWISPSLGARMQVSGWKGREGWTDGYGTYDYKYAAAGIDVMVNLVNAFSKTDKHDLSVILFGGLGANKAWGREYADLTYKPEGATDAQDYFTCMNYATGAHTHNHVAFETRAGIIFDLAVNDHWSISLEGGINHIGSRGNIYQFNGAKDWQADALFGITYRFGGKAKKATPAPAPVVETPAPAPQPKPEPQPQPKPTPKPQTLAPKAKLSQNVYFELAKSTPTGAEADKVSEVAQWLKAHPTATATVKGYADSGTGTDAVNARYARQRAENVAKMLTDNYGIDASRLTVDSYGDNVQPFSNNESNRVVIVAAEEK